MMKKLLTLTLLALFFSVSVAGSAEATRIKDISSIKGVRNNQLFGYGIVTGLQGTGDNNNSVQFMIKSMVGMLQRMGINTPAADVGNLKMKNVAAVMVTGVLPPFAKAGSKIDVSVTSIGDAKSLKGGVLLVTPLKAANGEVYAVAQGPLSLGGDSATILTSGRIPGGAIVEREIAGNFSMRDSVTFLLHKPDFSTASSVTKEINKKVGEQVAFAQDSSTIKVRVPERYHANAVKFVSYLEGLNVETDLPAKVIIDEQTGTVVISEDVRISPIVVSHEGMTLVVEKPLSEANQKLADQGILPAEKRNETVIQGVLPVAEGGSVNEIAKALNAIGATPKDLIAIFQAIKASGALRGELQVL